MSIHISRPFAGDAAASIAEAVVAAEAPVRSVSVDRWSGRIPAGLNESPVDEMLWVCPSHIGVAIALSAADRANRSPATPSLDSTELVEETMCFLASAEVSLSGSAPLFERARACAGARRSTATEDPVIKRLSRALEAAERGDSFAGLYADALRLAIVSRFVGIRERDTRARATAPKPAPRRHSAQSGLVKWRLKRVMDFVDARLHQPVTLPDMAAAAGLSRMHFATQFRLATGLRAHEFLLKRRIERAQTLLLETREPLAQIALSVGFQTQAHFTTVFRRFVGDTPYRWRRASTA